MKIGFDAKRLFNNATGLGNYSRTLVRNLSQYYPHHDYHLYSPTITNQYFNTERFHTHSKEKGLSAVWRSWSMSKDWDRNGLEIYHGLSNELPFSNKGKTKTVVTIHDLIFEVLPKTYKWADRKIYRQKVINSCQYADQVLAISEHSKRDIIEFYGIESAKIHVIYQAVEDSYYQEAADSRPNLTIANLPSTYILSVGTFQERKNQLSILKAWRSLPKAHQIPIVLVGNGKAYKKMLHEYATAYQIPLYCLTNIREISQLQAIYRSATVFVFPSFYEGFGLPIVEALLSGVPVVCSETSAMPEAAGDSSILINPLETEEIAIGISTVLNDSERRDKMMEGGKAYALKTFDRKGLSGQLMSLYEGMMEY